MTTKRLTTSRNTNDIKGFTLIELSIVIVVIALIIVTMIAAETLINQGKIRTLIKELYQYEAATYAFKLEYNYLPGDIPSADSYWPGCNDSYTAAECNGDGNGVIDHLNCSSSKGGSTNWTTDAEPYRSMQHLNLAGLIPGYISGVSPGGGHMGFDASTTVFSKSGMGRIILITMKNNNIFKSGNDCNRKNTNLKIAGPNINDSSNNPGLTVANAYTIDKKIDDSQANTGKFLAIDAWNVAPNSCSDQGNTVGGSDFNTANLESNVLNCIAHYFIVN